MTIKVMAWVLEDCDVDDPIARLVLIGLANHGHDDGTGSRPSAKTLANYARCSKRTVFRKLKDLEASGVISRGDQSAVAHLPATLRPIVYDINLKWLPSDTVSSGVVTACHQGDDTGDMGGDDTAVTQNPHIYPSLEPSSIAPAFADAESPASIDVSISTITHQRIRRVDPIWDELLAACSIDSTQITKSARGAYNRAAADIRELHPEPGEITRRSRVFRVRWPGASLTPTSLARRWSECQQLDAATTPLTERDVQPIAHQALADQGAGASWRDFDDDDTKAIPHAT